VKRKATITTNTMAAKIAGEPLARSFIGQNEK
jgi:hypothetical protein